MLFRKYQDNVADVADVAYLMLATMFSELQKQHELMSAYDMIIHLKQLYEGQARHERYEISKALFQARLAEGVLRTTCTQDDWVHGDSRTTGVSVGSKSWPQI